MPHDLVDRDFGETLRWTEVFLEAVDIDKACVAGVSIGGTIALVLAARQNSRVARVIAINPYDYPPAGGIRSSSLMARLILGPAGVPVLGATLMRLRNKFVSDTIMAGGVASAEALSPARRAELYDVGERLGHYQGFLSLLSHERRWSEARTLYPQIRIPALLIYGEQDWAPLARPPRVARHPEETAQGSVRLLLGEQEVQRPTDLAFRLREANDVKFCRRDALAHETRRACIRRPDETQ